MPPLKGSVWTWIEGDTTGPDTNHLDSVLYPGLGRWVWNNIGTNYYETLIVSNLVAGGDSQWTNKGGILQPVNLTLPLLWTNRLSLSEGQTNLIYRSANRLVYSNDLPMLRLEGTGGTFDISWNLNTANMLASGGNNIALGSPLMTGDVFPGTDNTYNLGRRTAYGYWKDFYMKGTNCLTWYDSVPSTNWVAMETYMLGSQAIFNLFSETNGVNGPITGFQFQTNGVPVASFGTATDTYVKLAGDTMTGALLLPLGTLSNPGLGAAAGANSGLQLNSGVQQMVNQGKAAMQWGYTFVGIPSDYQFGWSSGVAGAPETMLVRDTAYTIAQRNSTAAQQFSIYDTYTDASNFRNATMGWQKTANAFVITTTNAGTALGTGGSIVLAPLGTAALTVATNGTVSVSTGLAFYSENNQRGYTKSFLADATETSFLWISVPNTNRVSGKLTYEVGATDGTDNQGVGGTLQFTASAKGTTVTAQIADVQTPTDCSAGSISVVLGKNVATNNVVAFTVTSDLTGITTTNHWIKWRLETPSTYTVNPL